LETVQNIGGKLVLITNRKSLCPNRWPWITCARRNGRYIASLHWIW